MNFSKEKLMVLILNYIQNLWEAISKIEQNNLGLNYLNDLKQSNSQNSSKRFFFY